MDAATQIVLGVVGQSGDALPPYYNPSFNYRSILTSTPGARALWALDELSGTTFADLVGGTETINASTGINSYSNAAGAPPWHFLRKSASDAALQSWGSAMLALTP